MKKMLVFILLIIFILSIVFVVTFYFILLSSSIICSNKDVFNKVLPKICKKSSSPTSPQFTSDELKKLTSVDIKFCQMLCNHSIQVSCHTYHLNKPTVFTVQFLTPHGQQKAVVKSIVEEENDDEAYWYQVESSPYVPTVNELHIMVANHVTSFIGRISDDSLKLIENLTFLAKESNMEIHKDFWNLLYDHEFLTSFLFEKFKVFPKLYDVCGKFYVVEYAQPLISNALLPINLLWSERLKKATELVRFIHQIDSMWYEPVHLCDVKQDHFGWNKLNKILFLDLDCVVTDSALKMIMTSTPNCTCNEDCSYFDCYGLCLPSKKCSGNRLNSNLQTLCYKMFLGRSDTSIVPLSGLLKSSEASSYLNEVLEQCSTNPIITSEDLITAIERELYFQSNLYLEL